MYAKPTLAALDAATATASCCRVIVTAGRQEIQVVNEPLCPFPAPTGVICTPGITTSLGPIQVCALPN